MLRRLAALSAALLALPMLAAGCGSKKHTATPPAQPAASAAITVSEADYKLNPAKTTVKAGSLKIAITNDGKTDHALAIEGAGPNGSELKSATVAAGAKTSLTTANLKPGTYQWYCPIDGHKKLGMQGTLTVK
ncbi:MAG TPA: cupredoxin domain-containing protein [Solirubrobacteraceae bacterium]|nr:cupredoxin domain-containing protein [Solirubrobacteraceae bacterium]